MVTQGCPVRQRKRSVRRRTARRTGSLSKARLDALIADATVDAYNEAEQAGGFFTMIEDNLGLPFETQILGIRVAVERVGITEDNSIVSVCRRGKERLRVPILEVPLPHPLPAGVEWIAAYRYWLTGRR